MAHFERKYSDEQRDAVADAIVDRGLRPKEAVARAAAGTLLPDLEPFEMNLGTARTLAAKERRKRRGSKPAIGNTGPPEERIDLTVSRGLAIIEHHYERFERKCQARGANGELSAGDIARAKALATWARELRALSKGIAPYTGGGRVNRESAGAGARAAGKDAQGAERPDEQLLAELERDVSTAPPSGNASPTNNGTQEHRDVGGEADTEHAQGRQDGGVEGGGATTPARHVVERRPASP